eukprot:944873-Amphidinium_carterae.1
MSRHEPPFLEVTAEASSCTRSTRFEKQARLHAETSQPFLPRKPDKCHVHPQPGCGARKRSESAKMPLVTVFG